MHTVLRVEAPSKNLDPRGYAGSPMGFARTRGALCFVAKGSWPLQRTDGIHSEPGCTRTKLPPEA